MTRKDFWITVLHRLRPTIQKAQFITWFQNTAAVSIDKGKLVVGVPNTFAKNWLESKYALKILQAAQEIQADITSVTYDVRGSLDDNGNAEAIDVKVIVKQEETKVVRKVKNMPELKVSIGGSQVTSQMLNARYTLDSYIVGNENRLPHAACTAVGNIPGGIYNPLYIYGGVGLGKTHLLQAIGNEVLSRYPNKVIKYITAERFVTEVVEAIGKRYMAKFKQQYRNVDVFLIDDIQFFARKDSSQQEFFHTFNELYNANKQIVLTSDRSPSELDGLDERLKSRFAMGMVVELLLPEYETRLAILQQKCHEFQLIVDPKVLEFIAANVRSSVRELEAILRQLVAESQLFDRVPTIHTAAEVLKRMNKAQEIIGYDIENKRHHAAIRNIQDVMSVVANYYGVAVNDMTGANRHREFALPRQICMYLIKSELGESYEKIGLNFGGRNHTTVMHACNKTAEKLKRDIKLVRDINSLKREMGL